MLFHFPRNLRLSVFGDMNFELEGRHHSYYCKLVNPVQIESVLLNDLCKED